MPRPDLCWGNQRVWFGASDDLSFVKPGEVDLVVTSPPYWDAKDYGHPDQLGPGDLDAFMSGLDAVLGECRRVARPGAVLLLNMANRRRDGRFYPLAHLAAAQANGGWELWNELIWFVPNAMPQPSHYRHTVADQKHEHLLVFVNGPSDQMTVNKIRVPHASDDRRPGKTNPDGRCLGSVLRIPAWRPPTLKKHANHPAAFPDELAAYAISTYSDPGDQVLDPFLGSGTVLKVAEALGRRGIGVELNPSYRGVIESRLREPYRPFDWAEIDAVDPQDRAGRRRSVAAPENQPPLFAAS